MNRIFKVIYSKTKHMYVVASELAKSHSKSKNEGAPSGKALAALVMAALASVSFMAAPMTAEADTLSNNMIGINHYYYEKDKDGNLVLKEASLAWLQNNSPNWDGKGANAEGTPGAITIGMYAVSGKDTITIGDRNALQSTQSVFLGSNYDADHQAKPQTGDNLVVVGYGSDATGNGSIAIGSGALADPRKNVSNTDKTNANKNGQSIALGYKAQAENNNIAIGANSVATAVASSDKGLYTDQAAASSYVSVGGGTVTTDGKTTTTLRRITNVADGAADTDVATIAQLNKVAAQKGSWQLTAGGTNASTVDGDHNTVDFSAGSDKNLTVSKTKDSNNVTIGLNKDLKGITSISNQTTSGTTTTGGKIELGTNGTTISGGDVSVDKNKITNLKNGEADTDAATVGQMNTAIGNAKTKYYSVKEGPQIDGFSTNENNDGASAWAGMAAGFETGTAGIGSTVVGSYSGVMNTGTASGVDLRGAASISLGTLNLNQNTSTDQKFSGVANSIIGQGNMTTNSNAAIILGAGNTITDSYKDVNIDTSTMKGSTPADLEKALQQAVPESGGQVMAIGGGNNISKAYKTQVVGLGNSVSGTELNYVEGFNNIVTGGTSNYIIGAKNTLSDGSKNIVFGDNHTLSNKSNNVVIGSADTQKELTASDAVVIGHNADVEKDGGVAIGSESVASIDKEVAGYDPETGKASTTWKSTNAAVSVGKADGTITRQITGVAAGTADTDAVNVAQIKKLASINASNIGANLKKADGTAADATDITNNKKAWAAAIGTGTVTNDDGSKQLVTGATVYSEVRPTKDGEYVKTSNTTGANLLSLDTQVKSNADKISDMDNRSVKYDTTTNDGKTTVDKTKITLAGEGGTTVTNVKSALNGATDISKVTEGLTNAVNLSDLQTAYNALDKKASGAHTALTVEGGTQANSEKDKYAGKNVLLHSDTDATTGKVTYDVKLANNLTGITSISGSTDDKGAKITLDTTDKNISVNGGSITNMASGLSDGKYVDADDALHAANLSDVNSMISTAFTMKANVDASNIGIHFNGTDEAKTANAVAWATALGTGKVGSPNRKQEGYDQLVTGGTMWKELRQDLPAANSIISMDFTTGTNLRNLDTLTVKYVVDKAGSGTNRMGSTYAEIDLKGSEYNGTNYGTAITNLRSALQDSKGNPLTDGDGDGNVITLATATGDVLKHAVNLGDLQNAYNSLDTKVSGAHTALTVEGSKAAATEAGKYNGKNIQLHSDTDATTGKVTYDVKLAKDLTGITSISGSTDTNGAKITLDEKDKNISINNGGIKDVATNLDENGKIIQGNENNAANMSDVSKLINNAADSNGKKLADKANVDASNIGKNLKGSDGKTAASADEQNTNENAWGKAIGTGEVADATNSHANQLVTGKTVYDALNGGMTKIVIGTPGKDGKDGADGKPGTIGLVGPAGTNGQDGAVDITIQKGEDGKDGSKGANGVDGKDGINRIVYEDKNGKHQVATMEDGLKFAGDDGQKDETKAIAKKLNNTVDIIGGATGTLTDNNIGVNNVDGKLKVQLAQELTGITSISGSTGTNVAKITLDTADKNISVNGGSIKDVASNLTKDATSGKYTVNKDSAGNAANMGDVQNLVNQTVADAAYTAGDGIDITGKTISVNKGDGLKFDGKKLAVNTGNGLKIDNGAVAIKASDDNLKVDSNGIGLSDVIKIGTTKPVTIDGTKGEVSGLTNTTWNSKADYSSSTKAATESQVAQAMSDAVNQAGANDTHVAAGSYAVNDQHQISMNLVDNNNNNKGTVTITDVAKASEMGDVSKLADGVKNADGTTTTVVDAINNVNTKIGDQKYSQGNTSGSNKYVKDGDSITSAIGKLDGAIQTVNDASSAANNIKGDSNIAVTDIKDDNGKVTGHQVSLNKDISVDSVKAQTTTTDTLTVNKSATIGGVTITDQTISGLKDTDIKEGSTNAVNGNTIWKELRPDKDGSYIRKGSTTAQNLASLDTQVKKTADLINSDGKTIKIGGSDAATKIDVSDKDGNGRTITGVVTDGSDNSSAANVGYVNEVNAASTQQIYQDMHSAYGHLNNNINKAAAGSNALAALHPLDYDPGDKASYAVGFGHYRNANAAAVGAFYQPNANTMVSVGVSMGNGDPGVNAGVSFKVGKGSAYNGMSKVEMAETIQNQAQKIDNLEKENQEMKKQIQEILAKLGK